MCLSSGWNTSALTSHASKPNKGSRGTCSANKVVGHEVVGHGNYFETIVQMVLVAGATV